MLAHLLDWLALCVRWLHVIAGIAWIGSSFFFNWLDYALRPREGAPEGLAGEVWGVHGGGFYNFEKYKVAPAGMPDILHWWKWEAYVTWLSGFSLLVLVYWMQAKVFLLEPGSPLSAGGAVALGAGTLVGGLLVYEALCRSPLAKSPRAFGAVIVLLATVVSYGLCALLPGRAAYIHAAALVGTCMAGNVFFVIIPNQKKTVAMLLRGETPDPKYGRIAKLRSQHNNYFTLPVVFVMISNHYPMTFGSEHNWAVLVGIGLCGAAIRHWYNLQHRGISNAWLWPTAAAGLLGIALVTAPPPPDASGELVPFSEVQEIIRARCVTCHSESPTDAVFTVAPQGVAYDTPEQIQAKAALIKQRAVTTPTMPLANQTGMTEVERITLGRWIDQGARID